MIGLLAKISTGITLAYKNKTNEWKNTGIYIIIMIKAEHFAKGVNDGWWGGGVLNIK